MMAGALANSGAGAPCSINARHGTPSPARAEASFDRPDRLIPALAPRAHAMPGRRRGRHGNPLVAHAGPRLLAPLYPLAGPAIALPCFYQAAALTSPRFTRAGALAALCGSAPPAPGTATMATMLSNSGACTP